MVRAVSNSGILFESIGSPKIIVSSVLVRGRGEGSINGSGWRLW